MYKRLIFVIIVLAITFGCAKHFPIQPKNQGIPYSIKEFHAIQTANDFRNSFIPHEMTKSKQSFGVKSIDSVNLPPSISDLCTRDSVFVINYYDNKGFSLVVSNEYISDVLVSTESGFLDSSKLFNDNAEYSFNGEEILYKYVESLIWNYENDVICRRISEGPATKLNPGENYNIWYTDTLVQPIVHFKWGQEYPFNKYMPNTPDTLYSHGLMSDYRGRYAVGCVIIAAMQMAAATCHPSSITLDSNVYYLSQFGGVSMYYNYWDFLPNNYDTYVSPQLKTVTNKLAYLLHWFGVSIGAQQHSNGGTYANCANAMSLLSSLDNARYGNWSTTPCPYGVLAYKPDIYAILDFGKPIMIRGATVISPEETEGHAWLIDGYISQHMTRPDDEEYHRYYVHFNWGWRGEYDGYYSSTNISGRIQQDSIYDTNPTPVYSSSDNYCLNTKYYPY